MRVSSHPSDLSRSRLSILRAEPSPTVFLGAGASISSGGRSAEALALELIRPLYPKAESDRLRASAFLRDYGMQATFENVLERLGQTQDQRRSLIARFFESLDSSSGYESLALLALYGFVHNVILSTNFDSRRILRARSVPRLHSCGA